MMYATRAFTSKSLRCLEDFRCHDGGYGGGLVSVLIVFAVVHIPLLLALDLITLPLQAVGATIAWAMNRRDSK